MGASASAELRLPHCVYMITRNHAQTRPKCVDVTTALLVTRAYNSVSILHSVTPAKSTPMLVHVRLTGAVLQLDLLSCLCRLGRCES